jgi:hypothetical protein
MKCQQRRMSAVPGNKKAAVAQQPSIAVRFKAIHANKPDRSFAT